jgi:hypothetical protein
MKTIVPFRLLLGFVIMLSIACAGLCIFAKWQAHRSRVNAEQFLLGLRKLKVGVSTQEDVMQLVASVSHGQGFLPTGVTPFCHNDFCSYSVLYYNSFLSLHNLWRLHLWRLHLTPAPVYFSGDLDVQKQRLVRIEIYFSSDVIPRTASASVTDEVPEISPVRESFSVHESRPSQIWIYIKPSASPAQRLAAYSFSLKCMDKVGGCPDAALLLPQGADLP